MDTDMDCPFPDCPTDMDIKFLCLGHLDIIPKDLLLGRYFTVYLEANSPVSKKA
ncbi:3937_t:CDS:2, partial [Funneliformis mosseae]